VVIDGKKHKGGWSAKNSVNSGKLQRWTILSQVLQGCEKGATTSVWSLEQTVKHQERGTHRNM
jgi:hypothetical protein